jgi:predicted RNase H-like nuclease (RuvC/YqgF family)
MDNSSYFEPDSPKSITMKSPTLKKIQSQEAETQTYNIESLLTLNSILEESNAALERDNEELQRTVARLEENIGRQETRRHIDNQYKLRIEQMSD